MRKDWKYILYLVLAFGLFVVVRLLAPKQHDWTVTYAPDDKDPYGAYAFNELLPGLFPDHGIKHSFETFYELKDSLAPQSNIFMLGTTCSLGKQDLDVLLNHVDKGGNVFISAQYFYDHISDTLKINTTDYLFKEGSILSERDSATLGFATARLDTTARYIYRRGNIHNYFSGFDTTRTTVIARTEAHRPITIRVRWGKGSFFLNSTPMAFTNIYLLTQQNHAFVSQHLSFLPNAPMIWSEYYQRGRMETSSPLRFILRTPALTWAYYITVSAILLFMIFEMKRKQRIIPIIAPLANTTLEFVQTIGNLYFQRGGHKNIAEKKINFFMDRIRTKYWLQHGALDETFIQTLSRKSGNDIETVRNLVKAITYVQSRAEITADELIYLNEKMEAFKG